MQNFVSPPPPNFPGRPRRWVPRIVILIFILCVLGVWTPAQLAMVLGGLAAVLALMAPQERGI
jgi:hypothetical protein